MGISRTKVVGAVLFFNCMLGAHASQNAINDIFHHKGNTQYKDMEVGKVVLYLKKTPELTVQQVQKDKPLHEVLFTIHDTVATKKLCNFVGEHKNETCTMYCVTIKKELDQNKKACTNVCIQYNPECVVVDYALFDSISQQKGLAIRFHNKEVLDRMKNHERAPLYVASKKKPVVIIDAGHGGSDHGAIGGNALAEKEVTLALGKEVAQLLAHKGIQTYLTRDRDIFVPLDARTSFANEHRASFFVSIHANSGSRSDASGIETFFLSPKPFEQVVALESNQYRAQVQTRDHALCAEGSRLAHAIHTRLIRESNTLCSGTVCDRSVKNHVAQVLLGVAMPSVIVEVGFLSNPVEAQRLARPEYLGAQASAICEGIVSCL